MKSKEEIAMAFKRMRLLAFVENGLIDVSRIQDRSYLEERLSDKSLYDQAPGRMFIETESSFLRAARLLGKRGDKESAIILLFTAIEHVTNFYIRVFAEMWKLGGSTIKDILSAPHPVKISDILPSLGVDVPVPMEEKISEVRAIRNCIVHPAQVPAIIDPRNEKLGSHDELMSKLSGLVLRRFYGVPKSLREHCERTYQQKTPSFCRHAQSGERPRRALRMNSSRR